MTRKIIRGSDYLTKLARKMRGMGYRMWSAYPTKAEVVKSANKLRNGEYYVRIVRISTKRGHPWPWAVYYKKKGGW